MPQDAWHQEKFIRRFIKVFPVPRFILLGGCFAFCLALLFLAFATLTRWAAVVTGVLIAITGFGLLAFFNYIRRVQRSQACDLFGRSHSPIRRSPLAHADAGTRTGSRRR